VGFYKKEVVSMSKNEDFEKMVKDIQKKINGEDERDFSEVVVREYRDPCNFGVIKNPDAFGQIKGPCGDTMQISLKIDDHRKVLQACFWTDGCGPSVACGNMITKMITGKTIEEISSITSKDLDDALMGLPKEHIHCTVLAINTLHKALENYNK
jgi:nitrogen fixation NifU-like protein